MLGVAKKLIKWKHCLLMKAFTKWLWQWHNKN